MNTVVYRNVVDRSGWPQGPWEGEPDKRQWQDEATGLPCLVKRGLLGAWCGYVGVPRSHPLYGKHYSEIELDDQPHGGLTFSGRCQEGDERDSICHIVEKGEDDDVWWLGFDCAHLGPDLAPGMHRYLNKDLGGHYWTIDEVKAETARLARTLSVVPSSTPPASKESE